ncbi:MAG: metalloregulator ArsR/SmtB family transcription factor [Alphaproteobacteria bacterium]|nr:metalloregulator ArsR/SmtB family transcription factor [Alphaproteobacteria bacterium]
MSVTAAVSSISPKRVLFVQFAAVAKAVAHEHRLELLEALAQGERSVELLAARTGLSVANASHHLQQLRRGGVVAARRAGKFVFYSLSDGVVLELLGALQRIGERNIAEVESVVNAYFKRRDDLEPVTRDELLDHMRAGAVTVIDVRPEDEFALGHLPGSINIPVGQLKRRLARLDRGKTIVAYCRGAYCVLSFEAVAALRARGYDVRRLEDGFPGWRAAGLPVDTGLGRARTRGSA